MAQDLPKIFSDDELAELMKQRREFEREHDRFGHSVVRPPPKPTDGLPESTLEQQFPHIAKRLCSFWPSEACALFIKNLIVNSDRVSRQGFPEEVLEDLLMLAEINELLIRRKMQFAPAPKPSGS